MLHNDRQAEYDSGWQQVGTNRQRKSGQTAGQPRAWTRGHDNGRDATQPQEESDPPTARVAKRTPTAPVASATISATSVAARFIPESGT
jgi:hypothetical protein